LKDNTSIIIDKLRELNKLQDSHWLQDTLFTWQWWFGVTLTVIPWILWIVVRKKDSTNRLLFIGFFVMLITSYLDLTGVELTLWYYEYKVVPTILAHIPWDFSLFPVSIMLLLQYKPDFNPYIKSLCFGVFCSFICEPIFTKLHFYVPIKWKNIYSFPVYILLYLICHILSRRKHFEPL
jgi:hypothetical protein